MTGQTMPKELQPHPAVPTWDPMSPGEKQVWLLDKALDCKRELLAMPMPDPNDDSIEAHRIRILLLAAADSTIEQTIRLRTNLLKPAVGNDDIEQIIEERRKKAVLQIERMRLESKRTGDASKKPH
jgi:hypothetical protein